MPIFSTEVARILARLTADTVRALQDGAPLERTVTAFGRELLRQAAPLILEQATPSGRGPRG